MEIEQKNNESLLNTLQESRSFKRNPIGWSIFYATSVATIIMFIILVSLSIWTITIGQQITELVAQGSETLADVQEIMPQARDSLRILREMCKHENFTKRWGDIC